MTYILARPQRLDLPTFARLVGLHPELVRQWTNLGLLEVSTDSSGVLWFDRSQIAAVARIQRLRAGFSLNYAAIGLVTDLLDRIAELEAELRARPRPLGELTWI